METILVVLCIALALLKPRFITVENLLHVLRTSSMQGLIAFGMTIVIIVGEIDLSVGAAASFAGCLIAWTTLKGLPVGLGGIIAILFGYAFGCFSGLMRVWFQVPTFITTLALLTGLKGAALLLTNGFPITSFPDWYGFLGNGYILRVPIPAVVLLAAFVLFELIMTRSAFGRAVYAVGGNPEAARLGGINVSWVRIQALAITGALAALSGLILASRLNSGTPDAAQGWELDVIAAVIIGGTSLSGGQGRISGTLVGILFMGVLANGMTLLDTPIYWQYVVRGVLIFAAVLINRLRSVLDTA
jgi:ribose/xylose/arabinose/galactoside ABC-type transport system permease subunit